MRRMGTVALQFQPELLLRARELRALSRTTLAERLHVAPGAVGQFESGLVRPDAEMVARLALALAVPVGFFARKPLVPRLETEGCHFRCLRSSGQYSRRQALRVGELTQELLCLLEEEGVEFPAEALSPLKRVVTTPAEIEALARGARRAWGQGLGPIHSLMSLLESKGVCVLPLPQSCAEVGSFSLWYQGRPYVMLSPQAASRMHFDAAHELGHLLMHEDAAPGDARAESEAERFAAAFLLPREAFIGECPTRWSLPAFRELKQRWRVPIRVLIERAYALGRLSQSSYRRALADLERQGMRLSEPEEWELERLQALRKALALVQADWPLERLAAHFALHESHLRDILRPFLSAVDQTMYSPVPLMGAR